MAKDSTLELISQLDEFMEVHEFMNDPDLDEAMAAVVKLMLDPAVPSAKAVALIVKLQAIAAKMSMMATIYTTLKKGPAGSDNAHKKNIYYTTAEVLNKLVDALKYTAKYNMV